MTGYRVEPLADHDRRDFSCGSPVLDGYFRERVSQDVRRRLAACFVVVSETGELAGFYTLAATSLAFDELSSEHARKLPRYPVIAAVLLGRLAVATAHQGKGLGMSLVADAIMRSTRAEIVAHLMIVDAKDPSAAVFYEHLGFERLRSNPLRLARRL